mgnify:CR=1 FL=1
MRYRTFGITDLPISELVLGGGEVGGLLVHQDEDTKLSAFRLAVDAGINWIDTAPGYGDGASESAIGWLLEEMDADVYVSTKVFVNPHELGDIRGEVARSVEQSLARLRMDKVDVLQLHNPLGQGEGALESGVVLRDGGVLEAMEDLRDQGLCDFVGISALGHRQHIVEVIDSARCASAQVYYNCLNPTAAMSQAPPGWTGHDFSGVLEACGRHGTAVMAIRVFAAGVLATDSRHGRESPPLTQGSEIDVEEARARAMFAGIGEVGGTRAQTALRFALANEDVSAAVMGLSDSDQLLEALEVEEMEALAQQVLENLSRLHENDFTMTS